MAPLFPSGQATGRCATETQCLGKLFSSAALGQRAPKFVLITEVTPAAGNAMGLEGP